MKLALSLALLTALVAGCASTNSPRQVATNEISCGVYAGSQVSAAPRQQCQTLRELLRIN